MDLNQEEIIISEEIKPFWKLLIAGILYVVTLYFLYLVFHYWSIRWIHYGIECLEFALTMLSGALFFSVRRILCLNTETKIIKIKYQVGNIKLGYSEISDLNYISVFKNIQTENIEVNLWYKKNQHLNITLFDNIEEALDCGKSFSDKLNIDLLDATEKGNSKWIENK